MAYKAAAAALLIGLMAVSMAKAETITFADGKPGALPKEFEQGVMGAGGPGRWEIVADDTAAGGKALAQLTTFRRVFARCGTGTRCRCQSWFCTGV